MILSNHEKLIIKKLILFTDNDTNHNMVSIKDLIPGKNYTFYEDKTCYFGKFLEIRNICPDYCYIYILRNRHTNKKTSINITPLKWITKVESLDDIFNGKTPLPQDVIYLIEEYS